MRGLLARYRGLLIVVVLLTLPVLLLYASARGQTSQGRLGEAVQWVTAPLQSVVTGTWRRLNDSLQRYFWLIGVTEENERLHQHLRRLQLQLHLAEEQGRENQRLQRLLHLDRELPGVRTVTARVIAVGESPSYRSIRIDRGREDGVQRRAGVITVEGVVGRVVRASRYWADVLLLIDAGSRLDVLVARSRARGMLRGAGQNCRIDAMDRTVDIQVGDQLLTSGFDGVFPKGVPVGRVTEVSRPKMGLYLDARVQAFAPIARLEEVQVLIDAPHDLNWPRLQGSQPAAELAPQAPDVPHPSGVKQTQGTPKTPQPRDVKQIRGIQETPHPSDVKQTQVTPKAPQPVRRPASQTVSHAAKPPRRPVARPDSGPGTTQPIAPPTNEDASRRP